MENKKPLLPKRFIMKVFCNRCGLASQVQLLWMPDNRIMFECFTCGDAEVFYMGVEPPNDEVPLNAEEFKIIDELIARKEKHRSKN